LHTGTERYVAGPVRHNTDNERDTCQRKLAWRASSSRRVRSTLSRAIKTSGLRQPGLQRQHTWLTMKWLMLNSSLRRIIGKSLCLVGYLPVKSNPVNSSNIAENVTACQGQCKVTSRIQPEHFEHNALFRITVESVLSCLQGT
jgi:hypothetical protein